MKASEVFPLRQKTVDVMTMKGLSPVTQKHYLREIAKFDRHTGHQLDVQTGDAIRDWILTLIEAGLAPRTTNVAVAALRLFYGTVLSQPEKVAPLRFRQVPDRFAPDDAGGGCGAPDPGDDRHALPHGDPCGLRLGAARLRGGVAADPGHPAQRGAPAHPQGQGQPRAHGLPARRRARGTGALLEDHLAASRKLALLPQDPR